MYGGASFTPRTGSKGPTQRDLLAKPIEGIKGQTPKRAKRFTARKSEISVGDVLGALGATGVPTSRREKVQAAELEEQAKAFIGAPLEQYGRDPSGRSLRLNPDLAIGANAVIDSAETDPVAQENGFTPEAIFEMAKAHQLFADLQKGGRRQRGGDDVAIFRLWGLLDTEVAQQAIKDAEYTALWLKAATHMIAFNSRVVASAGWEGTEAQRKIVKDYFIANYGPLYTMGGQFLTVIGRLAEQIFIKTPVTIVMFGTATVGFTFNFFRWVFSNFNEYGRAGAEALLSDDRAKNAAEIAVSSTTEAVKTAAFMALIANQLGLLPASAVLAAILWQLQASVATGAGRAYVIASLYAWYSAQPEAERGRIDAAAQEYARQAQAAVVAGAPAAQGAVAAAASELARVLALPARVSGQAVVDAAGGAAAAAQDVGARIAGLPERQVNAVQAVAQFGGLQVPAAVPAPQAAALQEAAPVAAVAAQQVPALAAIQQVQVPMAPGAAQGGRKQRGKKTRRAPKRRITRRARKYLAAPVFSY